jgi:hypothetical protein
VSGEQLETAIVDMRAETATVPAEFDVVVDAVVAASPLGRELPAERECEEVCR